MTTLMELADAYAAAALVEGRASRLLLLKNKEAMRDEARAALEAAVKELEKNAARYRWLWEKARPRPLPMVRVQIMHQGQYVLHGGESLDAAIDAARGET